MQMKNRTFTGKDPVSIIAFLPDFEAVYNAYNIYEGEAIWIYKHYLSGPVAAVIKG